MNNIQIVQTCWKEKLREYWRTFTSHVYLENTHFKSLWSNRYQHFTRSRRFLSFVNDLLGILTCGFNLLRCLNIGGALFHMCCYIIVFLEYQNAVRTSTLFFWLHIERLFNNNKTQRYFNRVKSMLIESQKVKTNLYLRLIYLGISASCILTEPFFHIL